MGRRNDAPLDGDYVPVWRSSGSLLLGRSMRPGLLDDDEGPLYAVAGGEVLHEN